MSIQVKPPEIILPSAFHAQTNPYAPAYEPEKWNDLPLNANDNVDNFFKKLNGEHFNITQTLQISTLLSLKNIVGLVEENDFGPEYSANSRIQRVLSPEEIETLVLMVKIYFSAMQTRANCYAYAINFMDGYPGAKPDPGMKTTEYRHGLYETYAEAVIEGAVGDGLIYAGTEKPPVLTDHYRVALLMKPENSYGFHWVRENKDGGWSGKDGHGPARDTDFAGQLFSNPETAFFGNYTLHSYFQVPKQGIVPVQFRR